MDAKENGEVVDGWGPQGEDAEAEPEEVAAS